MFEAVHFKTNKGYYASDIWKMFKDPHKEDWVCCPKHHIKVTPRRSHYRTINGKEVFVTSHFVTISESDFCPIGESDIHKKYKYLIGCLLESKKLTLKVGKIEIPTTKLNIASVERPEYRWERRSEDGKRRADVQLNFNATHPIFGKGIVFEIQHSKISEDEKRAREEDWFFNNYSLTWINPNILDETTPLTTISITHPWAKYWYADLLVELEKIEKKYEEAQVLFQKLASALNNSETFFNNLEYRVSSLFKTYEAKLESFNKRVYEEEELLDDANSLLKFIKVHRKIRYGDTLRELKMSYNYFRKLVLFLISQGCVRAESFPLLKGEDECYLYCGQEPLPD